MRILIRKMTMKLTVAFIYVQFALLLVDLGTLKVVQSLDTEWLQGESFALEMAHTGESVILKCQLSDPNISVTFFREGKSHRDWEEISPDGQKYSFVGKGKQQLLINNLNLLHDSGQFLCKADGIKIVDKKIQLLIIRGGVYNPVPIIRYNSYKLDYLTSEDISCEGRLSKRGKVALKWYKRINKTQPSVKIDDSFTALSYKDTPEGHSLRILSLMLRNVTEKDTGEYICMLYIDNALVKTTSTNVRVRKPKPPVIRTFPSAIIGNESDSVKIRCKARGHPTPSIVLYVNGFEFEKSGLQARIKVLVSGREILIRSLKFPDHNVTITCKAISTLGTVAKKATLLVLVPPKIKKQNKNEVAVSIHKDHNISCMIERSNLPPYIHWEVQPPCPDRDTECAPAWRPVSSLDFRVTPNDTSTRTMQSQLTVPSSKKQDFHFRCTAKNEAGQDQHDFKYFYKRREHPVRPLRINPHRREVDEGKPIELTCVSLPGLFSSVSWQKDNKTIPKKYITKVSKTQTSEATLRISEAFLHDAGVYSCVGKLLRGGKMVEMTVVQIKAIFSPNVTMQNQTVNTTTTVVVLGCSVEAHPKADIEWYKDGIRLDVKSRLLTQSNCRMSQNGYYFVVRNGKTQTQDLVICKVDFKKNSGTYTCKAVNSVGNGSASAWLQVDAKPKILKKNEYSSIDVGQTLVESCRTEGHPTPFVFWERKVDASYKIISNSTRGNSTLIIHNFQESDYGIYRCVAENHLGDADFEIQIGKEKKNGWRTGKSTNLRQNRESVYQITLIAIISGSVIAILLLSCLVLALYRRKKIYGGFYIFKEPPSPDYFRNLDPSMALIEQTNKLPYDLAWEFPRKRIRLDQRLGSGAFGEVYLAEAIGILALEPREKINMRQKPLIGRRRSTRSDSTSSSRTGSQNYKHLITKVAVKKLKDGASIEEMRDLISELKILIHIGEHPNIVNLLGACTKGKESELMVILEYAPYGNLLTFLKSKRTIFKPIWEKQCVGMRDEFTILDLVSCAYQIAKGMEYLASRKCVHRDLAARNVLVGEGYSLKIADFGLARDIYKDDRYVKVSGGLLPIKWMAVEAIRDRVFTHQSDVWSYGVLLWELMTLGGSPYPGFPVKDLLDYLMSGYRMDQPLHCPIEVYSMMRECWMEQPIDRPIFFEIVNRFARIIEAHCDPEYWSYYLDPEHICADGYLRPIESPRSPCDVFTPPPPYTPHSDANDNFDNKFFGSEPDYLDNHRRAKRHSDIPENVELRTKGEEEDSGTASLTEIKAKEDANEKEKTKSDCEITDDEKTENGCSSSAPQSPHSPLPLPDVFSEKELAVINGYLDCDKDINERQSLISNSSESHRYVNEHITLQDMGRTYSNA